MGVTWKEREAELKADKWLSSFNRRNYPVVKQKNIPDNYLMPQKQRRTPEERYEKVKARQELNKDKIRANIRQRKYGISSKEWEKLFELQEGKCAICEKTLTTAAATDHCHKTNKIRGLLCNNCNTGLGMFKDDLKLLEQAVQYLK